MPLWAMSCPQTIPCYVSLPDDPQTRRRQSNIQGAMSFRWQRPRCRAFGAGPDSVFEKDENSSIRTVWPSCPVKQASLRKLRVANRDTRFSKPTNISQLSNQVQLSFLSTYRTHEMLRNWFKSGLRSLLVRFISNRTILGRAQNRWHYETSCLSYTMIL